MAKAGGTSVQARFPIRGWFADCHPRFRREFLALARPKSCAAGSVIYQAGEAGQDVFGISSGFVVLQCRFTHADAVQLHMLRPGDWFGTLPLFLERTRRVTAVARTDVDILRIPGDELRTLLGRRPEWYAELGRDAVYSLDLAMLCNLSRNTCSRVVKEFSSRGLVTLNYRILTLNDPARLRVVADAG